MHASSLRHHCERRLNALDRERASWFAHWRELSDDIMPRRGNFLGQSHRPDRGGKRNPKLLDSTAHGGLACAAGGGVVPDAGRRHPRGRSRGRGF